MTVWILSLLLLASLVGLGYRQGAIRVAFSLVGILVAALFALLLGKLVRHLFPLVGIKNPITIWLIPPVVAFIIVLVIFKVVAFEVHRRVEVGFKYQKGDLRFTLWERLNRRLGACLGLINALAYMILLAFAIPVAGYYTTQMATPDGKNPWYVRALNSVSQDLDSTGMSRVGFAINSMPADYYNAIDVLGMIYHNPFVQDRLATYPAFLNLAERPEFAALGTDGNLGVMRLKRAPFSEILKQQSVQGIVGNVDTLKQLWAAAQPNLTDLGAYLKTGQSALSDANPMLGYWDFDLGGAISAYRKSKAKVLPNEMREVKQMMIDTLTPVTLILAPDNQAYIKDFPQPGNNAAGGVAASQPIPQIQGTWEKNAGGYDLSMTLNGTLVHLTGSMQGDRLVFTNPLMTLVFAHE